MESFKRFVRGAFDRGGVQVIVGCLILCIQQYCPSILGPISVGFITAGAFSFASYVVKEYNTTQEDVRYQELLRELDKRIPDVEEHLPSSEELRECFFRIMSTGERVLEQVRDPPRSLIQEQEEIAKNFLAVKIAHEIVDKWLAGEAPMQEIFKHNFEEAKKRGQEEETPEEVLREEAAGEVEDKKIGKTLSAKVTAKAVLKEVAANKALMQEIVKNVLQEAEYYIPEMVVAKAATPGKVTCKTTMEEVAEEVLKDRYLIEDVLEKIFIHLLPRKTEQKDQEEQKLPVKLQENLEIEDGKILK